MKGRIKNKFISIGISVCMLSLPVMAEEAPGPDDYIVFLPNSESVTYSVDMDHYSEEFSTDQYKILFYKPGETVQFRIETEKNYVVEDALSGTVYEPYLTTPSNSVMFVMPETDLCLELGVEEDGANRVVLSDGETQNEDMGSDLENGTDENAVSREEPSTDTVTEAGAEPDMEANSVSNDVESTGKTEPAGDAADAVPAEDPGDTPKPGKGEICIQIGKGMTAKCEMVDGTEKQIGDGEYIITSSHVDIITLSSETGFASAPSVSVKKDGKNMDDISSVVINKGGSDGVYRVDISNRLDMEGVSYHLSIM